MPLKHLMTPLSRLLGPAAASPDSASDAAGVSESASPAQLTELALTATDAAVRATAVSRLPDGTALRQLAGLGSGPAADGAVETLAQQRLAELIDSGAAEFPATAATPATAAAQLALAALCTTPVYLERLLAAIGDPQALATLVVAGASSRIRQLAAQRIEEPEQLRQLIRAVREKDKSVYRILKHKADALRESQQSAAQLASEVQACCAALDGLSHRFYDALYPPTFEHFAARWQGFEPQATPELRERARQAIDRCREVIDRHDREQARQAEGAAQVAAQQAAREAARAQAVEETRAREAAVAETAAQTAAEAAAQRAAEAQARADRQAAEALLVRQVGALIARTHGALREGHTGPAAGLRRAIEAKLARAAAVPPALARQVHDLDVKLNTLKEWKDYAVAPKRAELIMEMEALVGISEPPPALAERIRDLREQWKTISKGIVSESEADWQRFNQAAEAAYQPCREYFEAQARQRQQNVEARRHVLERLLAFEAAQAGEQPDWRSIGIVLREAREAWRRIHPVERAANAPVQTEFEATLRRLQQRLDDWQAQNVTAKQALIARAQQLLTLADGRDAVEGVKTLQRQWKDVGPAPRSLEESLWNEFRGHCDAVFQRRQQAYVDYAAGLETGKTRAQELCASVEQAAQQTGAALTESAARVPQWRSEFAALGELPRNDERALHARFERALRQCETALTQQRAREATQSYLDLLEAARLIQAYGWATASGVDAEQCAALRAAAETFVTGVSRWPKGSAPALKEAWSRAAAATAQEAATNEGALRQLCIRSEIHDERPTPTSDQTLRREYQMQRLVRGMGQRGEEEHNEWPALALEWARVGAVAPEACQPLLDRFMKGRR